MGRSVLIASGVIATLAISNISGAESISGVDVPLSDPGLPYLLGTAAMSVPVVGSALRGFSSLRRMKALKRRRRLEEVGVDALLAALAARDNYTSDHSEAVVSLAGAVARRMHLPVAVVSQVEKVARLHDIGKIGIPDSILRKPGSLDSDEWELMRQHPIIGARIAQSVGTLAHLAPAIRAEHERWDGMGYPDGLAGRSIPLASRIILACDAYHAMVSDRPYRKAMDVRDAFAELQRHSGSQFCPETTVALIEILADAAKVLALDSRSVVAAAC